MNSLILRFSKITIFLLFLGIVSCGKTKQNEKGKPSIDNENTIDSIKNDLSVKRIDTLCFSGFKKFFNRFSNDTIFQKERIIFPLKKLVYDYYESEEPKINMLEKEKFSFLDFSNDKQAINREINKYVPVFEWEENCIATYKHEGYDNGIMIRFKFKKQKENWFLFEIIDESS
jgi:hypothetical protein